MSFKYISINNVSSFLSKNRASSELANWSQAEPNFVEELVQVVGERNLNELEMKNARINHCHLCTL
jgi:hypothetical protein